MIEPGMNMQENYPQDPENYRINSSWREIDAIRSDLLILSNLTCCEDCLKKISPDAARLIMDNTLIIRQLLDIMTRTMKSQLR